MNELEKTDIDDEFEKCVEEGRRNSMVLMKFHISVFLCTVFLVVIYFMIPRTFWLIPSSMAKDNVSTDVNPKIIEIKDNIKAAELKNSLDYFKLIRIKSLKNRDTYYIMPLAEYSVSARIKSKNKLFFNQSIFDKIALVDFGLVWGDMASNEYFKKIYSYSSEELSGARSLLVGFERGYEDLYKDKYQYLYAHSSHTHVIPSNKKVMKALNAVKYGQKIKLEGFLVDVYDSNYSRFAMSSLSLSDSNATSRGYKKGGGACEIMYVTSAQIGKKIFK